MDNNFRNAQRAYDRQEPPEDIRCECPDCGGSGTMENNDICEPVIVCKRCKGDGELSRGKNEKPPLDIASCDDSEYYEGLGAD